MPSVSIGCRRSARARRFASDSLRPLGGRSTRLRVDAGGSAVLASSRRMFRSKASARVIALQHYYPVRTDAEAMWEEGHVMLGFDADERGIRKLPHLYGEKVVWGSRYPHDDTTSAWDAIEMLTQSETAVAGTYRTAGGDLPESIRRAVETSIRGEALDSDAERVAQSRGWR